MTTIFSESWERDLEKEFLSDNRCRKRAYICSPLNADTEDDFIRNMRNARTYMYYASTQMNLYARAPHAYLPMILCDRIPSERALALWFGLRLLEESEMILVCGNRISHGMRGEISHAISLNMPIIVFDDCVYSEAQKLATQQGGNKSLVKLDRNHFSMALASLESICEKEVRRE